MLVLACNLTSQLYLKVDFIVRWHVNRRDKAENKFNKMKKIIFILLAVFFSTGAMAQTDKHKTEAQLENTIAKKKVEKHKVGNDLEHAKVSTALKDRKKVEADKKIIHKKANHLKKDYNVKHPIIKAQKEVKEDKVE